MKETFRQAAYGTILLLSLALHAAPAAASPAVIRHRSAIASPVQESSDIGEGVGYQNATAQNITTTVYPLFVIHINNKTIVNNGTTGYDRSHINTTLTPGELDVSSAATNGECYNSVCLEDIDCGDSLGCVCNSVGIQPRGFCGPPLITGFPLGIAVSVESSSNSSINITGSSNISSIVSSSASLTASSSKSSSTLSTASSLKSSSSSSTASSSKSSSTSSTASSSKSISASNSATITTTATAATTPTASMSSTMRSPILISVNVTDNGVCGNALCQRASDCGSSCTCVITDTTNDVPTGQCFDQSIFDLTSSSNWTTTNNTETTPSFQSSTTQALPRFTGLPHFDTNNK